MIVILVEGLLTPIVSNYLPVSTAFINSPINSPIPPPATKLKAAFAAQLVSRALTFSYFILKNQYKLLLNNNILFLL